MNNIQEWIKNDQKLSTKLFEIQSKTDDINEQAIISFWEICNMYKLPKFPGNNQDSNAYFSVYEQLAFLNFLRSDNDLRGNVLEAIFYIKNEFIIDMQLIFEKQFGNRKKPVNLLGIGYSSFSINVNPIFVMLGENWIRKGCKYFTKVLI